MPQQQDGVRSRPRFNSQSSSEQSFSSESSFEEGFSSQLSSDAEGGSRSKQPGDFQTIFGEFRPGQTFATLQSVGGSSIGAQSARIPPTRPSPQTINQQRFEQNQIVEQPQRFRQPQRFEQDQRFEPAQIFEQPRTTAQPQRFEQPRTSVQPQRFEQPRTGQAQNQRFSPQQPSRSQQPGSVQRFTPQLQNSGFEQRQQQNNLNQFEQNKLNIASSSSNPGGASNLRQNSFQPPPAPQQPVRQSGFQQVALKNILRHSHCKVLHSKFQDTFDSFFSGSTFPPSFPAMETPRLTELDTTPIFQFCSGRVFRATSGSTGTLPPTST